MRSAARRRLVVVAAAAGLTLGLGPSPEPLDVTAVDLSGHPSVRIVFTAPETMQDAVIDPSAVTLRESGEEQAIRLLPPAAESLAAVLVIDVSGSMAGAPLAAAKDAAVAFVERMPEGSDVALVEFGSQVRLVADFGTPRDEMEAAIRGLTLGGNTALYDAIIESFELVRDRPETRHFVLLLTDGADTVSRASRADVVEYLADVEDVDFIAVELQGVGVDSEALEAIAAAAGGRKVDAEDPDALLAIYDEIAAEIVTHYAVEYETARGGATVIDLEVVDAAGTVYARSFTVLLPPAPVVTTTTTTEPTVPPTIPLAVDPPPIAVAPNPGPFAEAWTLVAGAGAFFVTLAILGAGLLRPADGVSRRLSVLDDSHGSRESIVARLAEGLTGGAERIVARSDKTRGLARSLEAAGVTLRPGEFAVLVAVAVIGGLLVGLALARPLIGLLLAMVAVLVPRLALARMAGSRRQKFADQLDGALQLIAGSLRAGYGLTQALDAVASDAPKPISDEFHRVIVEIRLGRDMLDAMLALARRMDSQDMVWVAEAVGIQREVGGDLSEVLDTVSTTIRERAQIKRQIRALSAEGRISALVLILLPIILAVVISVINPEYMGELTGVGFGRLLLVTGVGLMIIGVIWIRRIIKFDF